VRVQICMVVVMVVIHGDERRELAPAERLRATRERERPARRARPVVCVGRRAGW
jgi:hypothetical protein